MTYINKTSLLVPSQLPEFVRDDANYENFVLFLQAYYEWMEQSGGMTYGSKNLPSYYDIDTTLDDFLQYFKNDFLPFFPEDALVDPRKLTKIAKELYQTKGTPSAFQFLFRVLYNKTIQLYNASDYVLRASDGKWIVTKYLTLNTTDPIWSSAINYRLFGQTSTGYATIQDVITGLSSTKLILSGVDRNFISGEYVTVVDTHNAPVLFNGNPLVTQIIGSLSGATIDPVNSGSGYNVGDPIVFHGGLSSKSNAVGASGYVSSVSSSSLTSLTPTYIGQGYRTGSYTTIDIISGSGAGSNAKALVTTFDSTPYYVYLVPNDTIDPKKSIQIGDGSHLVAYGFANLTSANYNSRLIDALSFPILTTYGISGTKLTSGGTGYDLTTSIKATGYYTNDSANSSVSLSPLPSQGILGPIIITNGGINYKINDKIVFTGGSGFGAFANVTSVGVGNTITSISYVADPTGRTVYPLGGMGYLSGLPSVSVSSSTGSGAILSIPGIVGGDAQFSVGSTLYGQVQAITLTNPGLDYVSAPKISLRVEDILVYNVDPFNQPISGDIIFQGTTSNQTFSANVANLTVYQANSVNAFNTTYNMRIYDYNGSFSNANNIYILRNGANTGVSILLSNTTTGIYTQGRKIYGNGTAKATANFVNGVVLGAGFYENADGQPSAYSVLENENYNSFAYILQVQKALAEYKNSALSFLHPSGLKYNTFNILKNEASFNPNMDADEELLNQKLSYLLGTTLYVANLSPTLSNTIIFYNTSGANVANVVTVNSYLTIYTTYDHMFYSKIKSATANTITLYDNWNAVIPNVAIATANAGSNIINISSLTNSWNIATGNTVSYISDFINTYDQISFDGVTYKSITHVDQPNQLVSGKTITVNSAFGTAQSGYLTVSKNVVSSNVWVAGIVQIPEVTDITTEAGDVLMTENSYIILLG
jgi:hypothetical protein